MASSVYMPMSYASLPTEMPMLYHEGASLNCQRVRLAFAEKGIKHNSRIIVIHDKEHLEPWFLRIQPLGTVPMVKHGPIRMIDTEAIILYLDQITTHDFTPKLQPDLATKDGQKSAYYQKLLKAVNVELIVTGSGCYRHHTVNCQLPLFANETFLKTNLQDEIDRMKYMSQKHPDLRYEYLNMSELAMSRFQSINEAELLDSLEQCNKALGEVECELAKREQEYAENPSGDKPWLCGPNFTMGDIYLSTLLHRMVLAGQRERLWGNGYRPLITSYYERVRHRPTFQQSCMWANEVYSSVILPLMTYKARKSAPYVVGFTAAAVGITIAAMIYYKGLPALRR